jgi:hypothetical protein
MIFLAGLVTIWLWAPLSSDARHAGSGKITTETYFGPFRYLTVHTELTEPNYSITRITNSSRLALTIVITLAVWIGVIAWILRARRLSRDRGDGADPQQL